jgi:ApaG protein
LIVSQTSKEIKGLSVALDRLVYFYEPNKLKVDTGHMFIYFITISNLSQTTVTLKGRRWVIKDEDGRQNIIDGQGIVGKEPKLATGESFSYNSYHTSSSNCAAHGSFHGIDSSGAAIHVRIPKFQMNIPPDAASGGLKEIKLA